MLIICPNCETSYDVSAASLGAQGRTVRCVRCRQTWFATPPAEPSAESAATVSAAAASARYAEGAAAAAAEPSAEDAFGQATPAAEEDEVDPNLAARAAERTHATFDEPPSPSLEEALASFDAPPLAPAAEPPRPAPGRNDPNDIESIAARRARRQKYNPPPREIRPGITLLVALLLAANGAILLWRYDIVRSMPQTASLFAKIGLPVNLRGVAFTDVTTTKETHEGVTVLVVNGTIANNTREPHEVPRIRFALRNAAGGDVYTWTTLPERGSLGAGESEAFQTRLASPPAEGREVVVRFFSRRDLAAGGH